MRNAEGAAAEALTSPVLSHLRNKSKAELLAVAQHAERDVKRYEAMLRVATSVLEDRGGA
jgi:hypothetical protein